jgi:PAS domain S-box-containing protein
MKIEHFIKRELQIISPYSGVKEIKNDLIRYSALVVQDEDGNILGLLTPFDIIQRPHTLVIDCLVQKKILHPEYEIETALQIMQEETEDILPVYNGAHFEGIIFKRDLINFFSFQNIELLKGIKERTEQLKLSNENIKTSEKIFKSIYDSTQSVNFIISPDYKIMFFNRKAQALLHMYEQEIKTGNSIVDYITYIEDNIYPRLKDEIDRALNGEYIIVDRRIKYKKDATNWFNIEYFPIYENEEAIIGVAVTINDIDERKLLALHVQMQSNKLNEIAWIQSHRKRQPVARILGLIGLIDKSELTEKNKEILNLLEHTTNELDHIINDIVIKANY